MTNERPLRCSLVRRTVALLLCLALGTALAAPAPAAASTVDLIMQVDGLVRSFSGTSGIYIADPAAPQPLYTHDPDEVFITASLYKLGILAHAESLVEAGKLRYSDTIEIQPEDITEDGSYELSGTVLTVDQALEAMITVSDNGTALAFWHAFGPANINATLQALGLKDFHIASDDNDDNTASPRVIGQYFSQLALRRLVSPAASDRMLARLERQQINDRLPAQLPPGTVVAHKTGNLGYVTHDAGIIYTRSGPRVVVGMTANSGQDEAIHLLSALGALVYSAVLEPPANARYRLPTTAPSYDAGSLQTQAIQVTNIGSRPWAASGPGSVGLIWEIRDAQKRLRSAASPPLALPALAPAASVTLNIPFTAPGDPGDYTLTVGLADASGAGLAAFGAGTGSFTFHVHLPFPVSAVIRLPQVLHRTEASLLVVQYSSLPAAGTDPHTYTVFWRAIDPATRKAVASGSSPLGTSLGPGSGTFFSYLIAPALRGSYTIALELRESGRTVSAAQVLRVEIAGARSYPDDRETAQSASPSRRPSPGPTLRPGESPAPRPSPSTSPRGRTASPAPTP